MGDMMRKIVIGDIHARWNKCRSLLSDIGVITVNSGDPMTDIRNPDFHLISLGDVVSLGYGEKEAAFLEWWFNVVAPEESLIGNHEAPAIYHDPYALMFHGFEHRHEFAERELAKWRFPLTDDRKPHLRAQLAEGYEYEVGRDDIATDMVREHYAQGRYKLATNVGDWLITHAGLAAKHEKRLGWRETPASEIARELNEMFEYAQEHGQRAQVIDGGGENDGGVLWVRIDYLRNGYDDKSRRLKQIIGHTGYAGPRQFGDKLWLIDTPKPSLGKASTRNESFGGVAALVTDDEGENWKLFYEE
jgi:hypothetical protein